MVDPKNHHQFLRRVGDCAAYALRPAYLAFGGIAALLADIALLLADERAPFAPVFVMLGGIAALVMAITNGSGCASTRWNGALRSASGGSGREDSGTGETAAGR
jgi:drug/metabolite transporter (DMT)-like permease